MSMYSVPMNIGIFAIEYLLWSACKKQNGDSQEWTSWDYYSPTERVNFISCHLFLLHVGVFMCSVWKVYSESRKPLKWVYVEKKYLILQGKDREGHQALWGPRTYKIRHQKDQKEVQAMTVTRLSLSGWTLVSLSYSMHARPTVATPAFLRLQQRQMGLCLNSWERL